MRRLIRAVGDDTGATLVFVAIVMVVLLGFVGLAIDVGAIFAERRELSRGADAAVLAIAEDCVLEAKPCTDSQANATAQEYANANADGTGMSVDEVVLDHVGRQGTVFARTMSYDDEDGTNTFKLFFMRALGWESTTVTADATAQFGIASGARSTPLIISHCEWTEYGLDKVEAGTEVTLFFHDGNNTEPCNSQAGQDLDGGFGWLETYGDCFADVHNGEWVAEDPGVSPPTSECNSTEFRNMLLGDPVVIPIFDQTQGQGANGEYRVWGIAAFDVTDYSFFNNRYKSRSGFSCPTPEGPGGSAQDRSCLQGSFVIDGFAIYDGDIGLGGTRDLGVYVVKLID